MTELSGRSATAQDENSQEHVREFVDADGAHWRVREMPFSEYDRRRGLSLIFWSDGAVRRVRDYPADWHTLSDEDLAKLSWRV
jgi:hypothetical protein